MQISLDQRPDVNLIGALDGKRLRVRDQIFSGSLIISARTLVEGWPVTHCDELTEAHWTDVLATAPEIILLGSGPTMAFPSPQVLAAPLARGVGVEVMDTPAACRTYNLLVSEGRAVTAALILRGE
jgi:uncharacterized protein